ncbi:MAG TPA: thioredoxin [Chromatiaceae bacterium]|nr:thioredoxin [Chromatiaceae bacterium]
MRILAVLLMVLSVGVSAQSRDPEQYFFDQSFGDFSEELQTAREQGKKGILIMFEMDECPFCHRMKTTVLNQPKVQEYYKKHFLIFSVDIEGDIEISDFQGNPMTMKDFAFKQFRVRATPVFQFFDLQGKPIKRGRYTGATKNSDEFLLLGKYIVERKYTDTSFTQYKRQMSKQ